MIVRAGVLLAALVAALALPACGIGYSAWTAVPVGWRGGVRSCKDARVEAGDALVLGTDHRYTAVKPGEMRFVCPDGSHERVPVAKLGRLAIEGPTHTLATDTTNPRYGVKAYGTTGELLDLGDPDAMDITWTTTAGQIGVPPPNDMAWWASRTPDVVELSAPAGKVTIGVTVGSLSTTLDVVIDPPVR